VANGLFSALAFIIGAGTSILCGYLGMTVSLRARPPPPLPLLPLLSSRSHRRRRPPPPP
jgi:hypothetical protein